MLTTIRLGTVVSAFLLLFVSLLNYLVLLDYASSQLMFAMLCLFIIALLINRMIEMFVEKEN